VCPQSSAPKPRLVEYTAADGCRANDDAPGSLLVGTFPTNAPATITARGCSKVAPRIYGHYAKNEEFIANYGGLPLHTPLVGTTAAIVHPRP